MYQTSQVDKAATLAVALALAASARLAAQERTADAQKRPAAAEAEHVIPSAQVPAVVREAFRRAYPTAHAMKYSTERENGKTVYEVESRDGEVRRDLLVSAEGTILEVETQVTLDELPEAVRAAATANGAHVTLAERVVAGRDTTYEFKIQGRRGELKLRPDGRQVPAERP
jgi:uncharacterized membrane protein YkoI